MAPFAPMEDLVTDPEPDLAIKRGLADRDADPGVEVPDVTVNLSVVFVGALVEAPLAARNVLLTETALKDFGLLTDEDVRP